MITAIAIAAAAIVIAGVLFYVRKGGKDAARARAADEALRDIAKVNMPISDADLKRMRDKYRGD